MVGLRVRRRAALPPVVTAGLLAAGLFSPPAAGAATGGSPVPLGLFGLPSVKSIVEGIVNFFFRSLARALVPDFLKHASVATIKWLVAVPNPTQWRHVDELAGDMRALSVSVLGVCFVAAIVRHLLGVGGSGNPLQALADTLLAAGWLVAYPWAVGQAIAAVNTLTDAVLSFPVVGEGLQRTVGVLFGGALLVGAGGVFLAVLVIVAVGFAMVMFAIKVFLLIAVGGLYVTGTLAIATRPLPELSHLSRAWGSMAGGIAIVPFGWTVLFALAGALSLDATSFGAGGGMDGHVAAALAALITFYMAAKLPFAALGRLRSSLAHGTVAAGRPGSGAGRSLSGQGLARVSHANARLRNATMATGRRAGALAGRLGAPEGGPVGAARRAARRLGAGLAGADGMAVLARGLRRARPSGRQQKTGAGERRAAKSKRGRDRRPFAAKRRTPSPPTEVSRRSSGKRRNPARSSAGQTHGRAGADSASSPRATGKSRRPSSSVRTARRADANGPSEPGARRHKPTSSGRPSKRPTPASAPPSSRRPAIPAPDRQAGEAGRRAPSKSQPPVVEPRTPKTGKAQREPRSSARRRPGPREA